MPGCIQHGSQEEAMILGISQTAWKKHKEAQVWVIGQCARKSVAQVWLTLPQQPTQRIAEASCSSYRLRRCIIRPGLQASISGSQALVAPNSSRNACATRLMRCAIKRQHRPPPAGRQTEPRTCRAWLRHTALADHDTRADRSSPVVGSSRIEVVGPAPLRANRAPIWLRRIGRKRDDHRAQ